MVSIESQFRARGTALAGVVAGDARATVIVDYLVGTKQQAIHSPHALVARISNRYTSQKLVGEAITEPPSALASSPSAPDEGGAIAGFGESVFSVKFYIHATQAGEYRLEIEYFGTVVVQKSLKVVPGPADPSATLVIGPVRLRSIPGYAYIVNLCDRFGNPCSPRNAKESARADIVQAVASGYVAVKDVKRIGRYAFAIVYNEKQGPRSIVSRENAAVSILLNGMPVAQSPVFPFSSSSTAFLERFSGRGTTFDARKKMENLELAKLLIATLNASDPRHHEHFQVALAGLAEKHVLSAAGERLGSQILKNAWSRAQRRSKSSSRKKKIEQRAAMAKTDPVVYTKAAGALPVTQLKGDDVNGDRDTYEPFDIVVKLSDMPRQQGNLRKKIARRRKKKRKQQQQQQQQQNEVIRRTKSGRIKFKKAAFNVPHASDMKQGSSKPVEKRAQGNSIEALLRQQRQLDAAQARLMGSG